MKNAMLFIFLLASVCHAEQVKFKEAPLKTYNDKLSLYLMMSGNEIGTGFYSISEEGVLDGSFHIESNKSGYNKELETNYSFVTAVTGTFKDGKKDGSWKYKYIYDDGVDLYESHEIEILYKNNVCIRSSFNGVIGHIMPKTKHEFESQQYCTPKAIRNKVWAIWRAEFEKAQQGK
jgi:hypothetical protein